MKVTVIRHLAFEDLGSFESVLKSREIPVHYLEAGLDDLSAIDPLSTDLLIILGGPISVNEVDEYPFLQTEMKLLQQRLAADLPTLGICLGAQLMARALGANVYPGECKEIGWYGLQVNEAGRKLGLQWLDEASTQMLHWHGETFDLPSGATRLAASQRFENQAFSIGQRVLALQFHPEVSAGGLERWYIGHTGEIHHTDGISVSALRAESEKYTADLQRNAEKFFNCWLDVCRI